MFEYLKKMLRFLKNNLALAALFPTLLGGIWQVAKLTSISVNAVRFFSISQLLIDGLLIIALILLPSAFYLVPFYGDIEKHYRNGTHLFEKELWAYHLYCIFTIVTITIGFTMHYELYDYISTDTTERLLLTVNLMFVILLFLYWLISLLIKKSAVMQYISIVLAVVFITVTAICFNNISKNVAAIENFHVLLKNIQKDKKLSRLPEVLYFNDRYIFLECSTRQSETVLIKKIDDLLQ